MKKQVIIFSLLPWDSNLLHREHMLAKNLKKLGYKVYFVEKRSINPTNIQKFTYSRRIDHGIEIITCKCLPYSKGVIKAIYKFNDSVLTKQLKKVFELFDDDSWLIASNPYWIKAIEASRQARQILAYDISDDLAGFATNNRWAKRLNEYEKEMIESADVVFVTTDTLKAKTNNAPTFKIENGVDLELFGESINILNNKFPRPIAGYIGGIYQWVDLDLIKEAAMKNSKVTFILVGPTNRRKEVNRISKLKNVHYLGEIDRNEISNYFASLDIGLVPFVNEHEYPRLSTVNSNKLFQYMYFGYPVITTSYKQTISLKNLIEVCDNKKEFISRIGDSLTEEANNKRQDRIDYAKTHSWERQTLKIVEILKKTKRMLQK